jgi:hypothetical protein
MPETTEILDNVIWLVNAFADEALGDIHDIPLLELAKAVTISPLPVSFASTSQTLERRVSPRYPTSKNRMKKQTQVRPKER